MSDGPHRSLPMRPDWKKLAEYADNKNFVRDPVRDAFARCEEEAGASAGPAQKRMGEFYGFAWSGFVRSKMD